MAKAERGKGASMFAKGLIAFIAVIVIAVVYYNATNNQSSSWQPSSSNQVSQAAVDKSSWYAQTINQDVAQLTQINQKYSKMSTYQQFEDYVAEIQPRLNLYESHLNEAYTFYMSGEGSKFSNALELRSSVEQHLVSLQTMKNQLNLAIKRYNEAIAQQQAQAAAMGDILKLLTSML